MKSLLGPLFFFIATTGCSHALHLSHIDDIQPVIRSPDAVRVRAQSEQFTVLGFTQDTDYVNQAYAKLQDSCRDGVITGINTRYSTSHGFLSWTNKVRMSGWCVRKQ